VGATVDVRSAFLVVSLLVGACDRDSFSAADCSDGGICRNGLDGGRDGSSGTGALGGAGGTGGAAGSSGSGGKGGSGATGGAGGVGGVGGGGGSGGTNECTAGTCERCRSCFELCFCQTGDGPGCVLACSAGGTGGVSGVGGTGGVGALGGVGGVGGVGGAGGVGGGGALGGSGGDGGTGGVPGWTCDALYYGTNDGCDCGCGLHDPDCVTSHVNSCEYCDNFGSCSTALCPGSIDPQDNATCSN